MAKEVNRLVEKYNTVVVPAIMKEKGYTNKYQVPRIEKIVVNRGLGDCKDNAQSFNKAVDELGVITGQKPLVTTAKKSIANFKVRQGNKIGAKVTLRGNKMYEFLDRLITIGDNCIGSPTIRHFVPKEQKAANVDKNAWEASSMIIKSKEGFTNSCSFSILKSLDKT